MENLKNRSIERSASLARINLAEIKVFGYTLTTTVSFVSVHTQKPLFLLGFEHVLLLRLLLFEFVSKQTQKPPPQEQLQGTGDDDKKNDNDYYTLSFFHCFMHRKIT